MSCGAAFSFFENDGQGADHGLGRLVQAKTLCDN